MVHRAFNPHVFGQGSEHFLLTQARCTGHSALTMHSGRHDGGAPIYSGKQVHTACPLIGRHLLLGPQGDGVQGSLFGSGGSLKTFKS